MEQIQEGAYLIHGWLCLLLTSFRLIAIMLGRLKMDIEECIFEFTRLLQTIWEGKTKGRFRNTDLENAITQIITSRGLSKTEPFNEISQDYRV